MLFTDFISIMVLSATSTSLGIEVIKTFLDNINIKYNTVILATIAAFVIGVVEIFIYYVVNGISITYMTFLYALCMGVANLLSSTVGYDKIKQFAYALFDKTE